MPIFIIGKLRGREKAVWIRRAGTVRKQGLKGYYTRTTTQKGSEGSG